jgi:glycosyltransferase involved in cell wall biosynthesis
MVAALIESKRVVEGIAAASEVDDAFVVVAGDGPIRDDVDAAADKYLPGRFRRMTVPSSEMPDLYRAATVVLHPTLHESFGNVYVEAMASGVPVVAHDYDVTRWIFGDHHVGLVDATDENALAGALSRAISGRDGSAALLVDRARCTFAWPVIAREYRRFLAEVVAEGAGR